MPSRDSLDGGKPYDWGRTTDDYAVHRPGYPDSFFRFLGCLGIGIAGQRVLDLASGPGVLSVPLAQRGAAVTALDIAENQVAGALERARGAGVPLDTLVADAHETGLPSGSYDLVTASMCVHYFDKPRLLEEVCRILAPGGRFLVASLIYLPRSSAVAAATEALILEHNPDWGSANFSGRIAPEPDWSKERLRLTAFHRYVEDIRFTRESWRGRIRACRGVGASLPPDAVERFDAAHARLLAEVAAPELAIPHLVAVQLFEPRS